VAERAAGNIKTGLRRAQLLVRVQRCSPQQTGPFSCRFRQSRGCGWARPETDRRD
jgi:hypothetical protein